MHNRKEGFSVWGTKGGGQEGNGKEGRKHWKMEGFGPEGKRKGMNKLVKEMWRKDEISEAKE